MNRILIINASVVTDGTVLERDLMVQNGRIEKIGADLSGSPAERVIDAAGLTLFPGMIDSHVHFREPGLTHKGCIATESLAAAVGGITSFLDMPNTLPATTTNALLLEKHRRAAGNAFANYGFFLGAANDNIEEIKRINTAITCGIKLFMGASTGNMLVDEPEALTRIFSEAPLVVAAHCEDPTTISENALSFKARYGTDIPVSCHPLIRSEEACFKSSSLAVALANASGARLHLLHLSTEKEITLLTAGAAAEKRITAEVCVHHLAFTADDHARMGTRIKCNPAIKSARHRNALLGATAAHMLDTIATDHAPHTLAEKDADYFHAPSGIPLVQHAFQSVLEHYHAGRFSLPLIAEKTAHGPAACFRIRDRGHIREGYWADLVLVDLARPYVVDAHEIRHRCGWSPFSGHTFRSTIIATLVSGHPVYDDGDLSPVAPGRPLEFDR